jgi:effector-binding domain-containing protein
VEEIELVKRAPRHLVGVRRKVPVSDLAAFFAEAFPKVMAWVQSQGVQPTSMPMAMWCAMDMETGVADVQAGCFVPHALEGEGEITPAQSAGGEMLTLTHVGGYASMGGSWKRVFARAGELGRRPGAGWEIYVDDPQSVEEAALRTEIYLPLA